MTFKRTSHSGEAITLPCGRCIGCRISRSEQWATRIAHEAQMHEDSCFITLTYDDEHLPPDGGLRPDDMRQFLYRLRWDIRPRKVRYFQCGEYGDNTLRPHHHMILFGLWPSDAETFKKTKGHQLYRSDWLDKLWGNGYCNFGRVTYASGRYVARYVLKKVTDDRAEQKYQRVDPDTGEVFQVKPEYITMSRRPGIGQSWLDKYASDVFPADEVIIEGTRRPVPAFYLKKLKEQQPETHKKIHRKRVRAAKRQHAKGENSHYRLVARETCAQARVNYPRDQQ